jgi:cardiolipin synthase
VRFLEDAGVTVAWFHPLRWYHLREVNNRTHRKVLVVDGAVGFTGGVGIAEEWEGDARDSSEWRDDHFRIQGPAVRHLQGAFAEDWREATGEVLLGRCTFRPLPAVGAARVLPLVTSPGGRPSPIAFLYWLAFQVANERVDIATPYFLPDDDLIEAMGPAVQRGVRVRLLVPGEHTDAPLLRTASFARYRAILDQGVELYEYAPTMLHTKKVSVDGRWTIVGSANFDRRSFELNNEVVLVVDDRGLASCLDASFEADVARARRIAREDVRALGLGRRVGCRLALLLRPHL